jgi:hypothetical protein
MSALDDQAFVAVGGPVGVLVSADRYDLSEP